MREKIGAIATPDYIQNAPGLPKTRSGEEFPIYILPYASVVLLTMAFMMLSVSVQVDGIMFK